MNSSERHAACSNCTGSRNIPSGTTVRSSASNPCRAMSARTMVCSACPWWLVASAHVDHASSEPSFKGLGKPANDAASSTNTVVRNAAEPGHKIRAERRSASNSASSERARCTSAFWSGRSASRDIRYSTNDVPPVFSMWKYMGSTRDASSVAGRVSCSPNMPNRVRAAVASEGTTAVAKATAATTDATPATRSSARATACIRSRRCLALNPRSASSRSRGAAVSSRMVIRRTRRAIPTSPVDTRERAAVKAPTPRPGAERRRYPREHLAPRVRDERSAPTCRASPEVTLGRGRGRVESRNTPRENARVLGSWLVEQTDARCAPTSRAF